MKLELDLWCCILDVYSKFQINISKHFEKKKPGKLKKSKTRKNNGQNSENKIFEKIKNGTYVEKYTEGYLRTKFDRFISIYESMIAKNEFDQLLAVN